jgi:hypothetical protein
VLTTAPRLESPIFSLSQRKSPGGGFPEIGWLDWLMKCNEHECFLVSAGMDHYPYIRVEVWEDAPPEISDTEAIERARASITLTVDRGPLGLSDSMGQWHPLASMDLFVRDRMPTLRPGRFVVDVACWGRREAGLSDAVRRRGVEKWLIRLWPETPWGPATQPDPAVVAELLEEHRAHMRPDG